jgi:TPR repeat protein
MACAANPRCRPGQTNCGVLLLKHDEPGIQLLAARSDLKWSLNQEADTFLFSDDFTQNADLAAADFAISASTVTAKGQSIAGWMSEHGIGIPRDIGAAARLHERSSELLETAAADYGWYLRPGRGSRSISRLRPSSFRQRGMRETTTARTTLASRCSAVKGLKSTSIGRFPIIEGRPVGAIATACTLWRGAWSRERDSAKHGPRGQIWLRRTVSESS